MLEDDAFLRSVSNAVGSIWLIEESPADTLEDVREQERLYAGLREDLTRRYARLRGEHQVSLWRSVVAPVYCSTRMPSILGMKTTDYFRRSVMEDPDRSDITIGMCEQVVAAAEYTHQQDDGLWRVWGYVPELDRYIRVITDADREQLVNAFKDRNFNRRRKREGR